MSTVFVDDLMLEDFGGFEGGNAPISVSGEVTVITAGEWVSTREEIMIAGKPVAFGIRYRFVDPILTSMALRKTDASTRADRIDFNATIVSGREMEVETSSGFIPVQHFVCNILRAANPNLKKLDEHILLDLKSYGLDLTGRLPMYLQHLGANEEAFNQIATNFQELGASNNQSAVASRTKGERSLVRHSYRIDEGIPVKTLEISKVDRSMSTTGTGFIGFFDAFWGTFTKIIEMDKKRTAIAKILASDPTNEVAAAEEAAIRQIFSTARTLRSFRNWGGTTRVVQPLDDSVAFFAQQVPCGRLSIKPQDSTHSITYSVWGTRAVPAAEDAATVAPVEADLATPVTDDAEPF